MPQPHKVSTINTDSDQATTMPAQAESFVSRWRKLPDELKLNVLRHVLPSGSVLNSKVFRRGTKDTWLGSGSRSFQRDILSILACPALASLGLEVLYTQNVLNFVVTNRRPNKLTDLPPKSVRKFIRTWKATLHIKELLPVRFRLLVKRLAKASKTEKVTLIITSENGWDWMLPYIRKSLMGMAEIYFDTNELEIVYTIDGTQDFLEDFTHILRKKLVIAGDGKDVEQEIERSVTTLNELSPSSGTTISVQNWPADLDPEKHLRRCKIIMRR